MVTFNPSHQIDYTQDLYRAYFGAAPTLGTLSEAYGDEVAEVWLAAQIKNLSEFAGCRDKLSIEQISELSRLILTKWPMLKVTEVMMFFVELKTGAYGRFYGAVDTLVISEAIREFMQVREAQRAYLRKSREHQQQYLAEQAHMAKVELLRRALAVSNMDFHEYRCLIMQHSLTLDEVADIGWLLRYA